MTIPIKKLLSVTDNRYEFAVSAMKLIDKVSGATIDGVDYDSWKIVPRVLNSLLEDEFKILTLKEVAELNSAQLLKPDEKDTEEAMNENNGTPSESIAASSPEEIATNN